MSLMYKLIHLVLRLFGLVESHTKPPELDGGAPPEVTTPPPPAPPVIARLEYAIEASALPIPPPLEPDTGAGVGPTPIEAVNSIMSRPFKSPLLEIPSRRDRVRAVYGRAPKEKGNKQFPVATLKVHTGLPGDWNNGKARLYMEESVGEHFREGLARAEELEKDVSAYLGRPYPVLSYMTKVGAYNHRHIRHDPTLDLSFHSWAIAFDTNPASNRGILFAPSWRRLTSSGWQACPPHRAQRGPVNAVLPFSKQWYEVYPESMPFELVMSFKSVYFTWGGDWGRAKWHDVVAKFGVGYDCEDAAVRTTAQYQAAMVEWDSIRYLDPMHFELVLRGQWAIARYKRMSASLGS